MIIDSHKLLCRQVVKKSNRIEDCSGQVLGLFLGLQEYIDVAALMMHKVGKLDQQISNDASHNPKKTDILILTRMTKELQLVFCVVA